MVDAGLAAVCANGLRHEAVSGVRGVVFDLDGTLVDSWALHCRCLLVACRAVGLPRPSTSRVLQAQRPTDLDNIGALVGVERAARAYAVYQDALETQVARRGVVVVPSARDVVGRLHARGVRTGICTGRSRRGAMALLRASGLDVPLLVAREDAADVKPAPEGLRRAVAALALPRATVLFVGDSPADAEQGAAAGIRTVLVGAVATEQRSAVPSLAGLEKLLEGDAA